MRTIPLTSLILSPNTILGPSVDSYVRWALTSRAGTSFSQVSWSRLVAAFYFAEAGADAKTCAFSTEFVQGHSQYRNCRRTWLAEELDDWLHVNSKWFTGISPVFQIYATLPRRYISHNTGSSDHRYNGNCVQKLSLKCSPLSLKPVLRVVYARFKHNL